MVHANNQMFCRSLQPHTKAVVKCHFSCYCYAGYGLPRVLVSAMPMFIFNFCLNNSFERKSYQELSWRRAWASFTISSALGAT